MWGHHTSIATLALLLAAGCAEHLGAARSGGFPTVPPALDFWPPPPATSSWNSPPHGRSFGEIAEQLLSTLYEAGYRDVRRYPIGRGFKHGFAITTRIERIDRDGSPSADRWSPLYPGATSPRWLELDRAPRLPSAGLFRIFVVAFTDLPAVSSGSGPPPRWNEDTVMDGEGLSAMPFPAGRERMPRFRVTTLVYEYTCDGPDDPGVRVPAGERVSAEARARARRASLAE